VRGVLYHPLIIFSDDEEQGFSKPSLPLLRTWPVPDFFSDYWGDITGLRFTNPVLASHAITLGWKYLFTPASKWRTFPRHHTHLVGHTAISSLQYF
jgi:hypothetical protein